MDGAGLTALDQRIAGCRACPRLVDWREEVARTKRAAFADWTYWGRPVPGFGPPDARLLIIGLAPAAHGGNRTGRMFTGDRSGDVLYEALYDVGLASQPTSVAAGDGLALYGVRVTAPVHCAPPANKPTPQERDTCRPWLVEELRLLRPTLRTAVVLGAFGWQAALPAFAAAGWTVPKPRPVFAHGARVTLDGPAAVDGPVGRTGGGGDGRGGGYGGADGRGGGEGTGGSDVSRGARDPGAADDLRGADDLGGGDASLGGEGSRRREGPGRAPGPGGADDSGGADGPRGADEPGTADDPRGIACSARFGGPGRIELFGCFHVSQRNTFTGRLTPAMLRDVLRAAALAAGLAPRD